METALPLPRPARQQDRSSLSTSRLLQAAGHLITEVGYEKTTLAAIGRRAGYSHGLVSQRFGSKDGLLLALLEKVTTEWHDSEVTPKLNEQVGVAAICTSIDAIRSSVRDSPSNVRALYALMFEAVRPAPLLHERIRDMHRSQCAMYESALLRGVDAGVIRSDVDCRVTSQLIVSAIRGSAFQWMLDDTFDLLDALGALMDHLNSTLSTAS